MKKLICTYFENYFLEFFEDLVLQFPAIIFSKLVQHSCTFFDQQFMIVIYKNLNSERLKYLEKLTVKLFSRVVPSPTDIDKTSYSFSG